MGKKYISTIFDKLLPVYGGLSRLLLGTRALPPLVVQIDLTYRCNLRCTMCFQKEDRSAAGREMSLEDIQGIIDRIPAHSVVTLTGGEPFVRQDIGEILEYALERHKVNLITNGTNVSQEAVELMVDRGLLLAGVSVDGIGSVHDRIRGVQGCFDKMSDFLNRLQKYKNRRRKTSPMIDMKTVLLEENIDSLGEMHRFAASSGVDFFTLSLPFGKRDMDDRLIDKIGHAVRELSRRESKVRLRLYPSGIAEPETLRRFLKGQLTARDVGPCQYPWIHVHIDPYGSVYPCQPFFKESLGLQGGNLMSVWNGKTYRKFRERLSKERLFDRCLTNCCYLRLRSKC